MKTRSALISITSLMIALGPVACGDDDVTTTTTGTGGAGGTGGTTVTVTVTGTGGTGAQGGGGMMNVAPAAPTNFMLQLQADPFGVTASWDPPPDNDLAGYIMARSDTPFDAANTPVDGQPYNVGDQLPGGADVVFAANETLAFDPNAPLEAISYYAVFAVDTTGLYSDPATDSIDVDFPEQDGIIEISNIAINPVVTINQQPPNVQLDGTATFNAGTLTLSLSITNLSNRVLFSPKVAVDTINAGTPTSDGTTVDGRVAAYYGPEGLAVGAQATRDIVINGFGPTDPVTLNVEVLNNPMGFAGSAYNKGGMNFFDISGATDNGGQAFGGQISFQLGWKAGAPIDGSFTTGVFSPDGERLYLGWKSRPVVIEIDTTTLQPTVSADLSIGATNYGIVSNVVMSADNASLYTLVTTGAHRFSGGPNYAGASDIDLVQLDRATLAELGRISLVTGAPLQGNNRPAKGNHVALSGDGSRLVAAVEPGQLWIIDTATFTPIDADSSTPGDQPVDVSSVSDLARFAAVNADGSVAYVGNRDGEDNITVVDLAAFTTSTINSTSTAGLNAYGWTSLSFGPDSNLYIARNYAQNVGDVPLSMFDTANSMHTDLAVDIQVMGLLFDPSGERYYVLQRDADAVNNNGEILTYNMMDHTLIDIDGNAANGQTNLPAANVSPSAAHGHGITPF